MSDGPDNLVLRYLRQLADGQAEIKLELHELKERVGLLETGLASVRVEIAGLHQAYAGLQGRLDRVDNRLDRIERRLDLQDARA